MTGVVTLVQEGRFRLHGDDGRSRLFMLAHDAPLEPQDLPDLQASRSRVTVRYEDAADIVAGIAHDLEWAGPPPQGSNR